MLLLNGLGIQDRFDAIVLGDELEYGKPHPLPYLHGLEKLSCSADNAFAFEDSLSGLQAATAAKIHTFGMMSSLSADKLKGGGAHSVIRDFDDEVLWTLLKARVK